MGVLSNTSPIWRNWITRIRFAVMHCCSSGLVSAILVSGSHASLRGMMTVDLRVEIRIVVHFKLAVDLERFQTRDQDRGGPNTHRCRHAALPARPGGAGTSGGGQPWHPAVPPHGPYSTLS